MRSNLAVLSKKQKLQNDSWDSEGEAMHGGQLEARGIDSRALGSNACMAQEVPQWYALQTRPRHEKKVAAELQEKGITAYLPLLTQVHRWSDRRKIVQVPLFSCYAFVHANLGPDVYAMIYGIVGALGFVGAGRRGLPIPEQQIKNIQTLLAHNIALASCPFLKAGQRVRVRGGAMDGVEGILAANGKRLVISVETISHSLSISIEGLRVEPVK